MKRNRKSSLFADKNRVGKGDWDRGRGDGQSYRRDGIIRAFGDRDFIEFQKNAGFKRYTYK